MKQALIIASLFAAAAQAQTLTIDWEARTLDGQSLAPPLATATQGACDTALRARNLGGTFTCVRRVRVNAVVPPAPPPPPPAPPPPPPPSAPPPSGTVLHFSDCQPGAAPNCVPGNDANPGTLAAPKRTLASASINTLPAGTQLLLSRGGAFSVSLQLENRNATPTAPIIFDAYGSGPAPLLLTAQGQTTFGFGQWGNTVVDGGYTFRNLRLDGGGVGQWGFWLHDHVRNVTIENVEVSGFVIAIHSQNGVDHLTVRNSNFHHNRNHGMLGGGDNMLLEGNRVAENNPDGGPMEHGFYLSHGTNVVVRNNQFLRNSAPGGVCNGGNFTLHGQLTNWLIEGNRIEQDAATNGCYGLSITTGYSSAEWFRQFTVRGNTVINTGLCAICAGSAPGIVVENNRVINHQQSVQIGVQIPTGEPGVGDDANGPAIVRNNTFCFVNPAGVPVRAPGSTIEGSSVITGSAATGGVCAR